jgi:hypothetical protein
MRKLRSFRPTVFSQLEDRVVLSQGMMGPPALMQTLPPVSPPVSNHVLLLNGTLSGTFVTTINSGTNSNAGTTTTFQGSGTITGLGQVSVTGTLVKLVSPTGQTSSTETFTLSTATGSITIQLTKSGPVPSTPSTAVSSFSIVKATGAFQGDIGAGTANLQTITDLVPVVPPTVAKGHFTLTLSSNPAIV